MTLPDALSGAIVLVVELVAIGAVCSRLAPALVPGPRTRLDHAFTWLVLALVQVLGVSLVLGAVGLFSEPAVMFAHVLLAIAVYLLVRRAGDKGALAPIDRGSWLAMACAASVGMLCVVDELTGPSTNFDTRWYHIINAAHWVNTGTTWGLPFAPPGMYWSSYPGGSDLVGAWLILPAHSDQLAYFAPVVGGLLLVLSVAIITRQLGGEAWVGALVALALMTSPLSWATDAHSLMSDDLAAAGVLGAIALVLTGSRRRGDLRWALLTGACLGLGVGAKYTAYAPALAVLVVIAILAPRGARIRTVALVALGCVALGGFWPLRNLVSTGNPLFPAGISIAGHALLTPGVGTQFSQQVPLSHWILALDGPTIWLWLRGAVTTLGPAILIIAAGLFSFGRRKARDTAGFRYRAAVGAIAVFGLIAYTITPFSGGLPGLGESNIYLWVELRYAYVSFGLLSALAAAVMPRRLVVGVTIISLGFNLAEMFDRGTLVTRPELVLHTRTVVLALLAIAGTSAFAAVCVREGWRRALTAGVARPMVRRAAKASSVALLTASLAAALVATPTQQRNDIVDEAMGLSGHPSGGIAVIGIKDIRSVLGPQLSRTVVAVGDGRVGQETEITEPVQFNNRLAELAPAVAVVGPDGWPQGWVPPAGWKRVGSEAGGDVYVVSAR